MISPLDLSLITGPIPVVATVAGAVALLCLAVRKDRRWWTRVLPAVVLACAAVVAGATYLVDHVWKPWPEPLPPVLAVWAGATPGARPGPWRRPAFSSGSWWRRRRSGR